MNRFKSRLTAVAALTLVTSFFSPIKADAQPLPACTMSIPYSNITFTGTGAGEVICLLGNNITVDALGGDDTVIDYGDNNHIFLGEGFDVYAGGYGQGGDVDGGAGNDYLVGSSLADDLDGGSGDDTIIGAAGDDTLNGGLGADDLYGDAGADSISGESGADSLDGGDGADLINGGDGDDTLIGAAGDDTLNGGLGADDLSGDIGNDALMGESGTDSLSGGDGDDVLAGGQDIDVIVGGAGLNVCDYDTGEALTATCKYDDTPPELVNLSFSASVVDSTANQVKLDVSLRAKDQIGLAAAQVNCQLVSGGETHTALHVVFSAADAKDGFTGALLDGFSKSGTDFDRTLTASYWILKGAYPGDYTCRVILRDKANKEVNQATTFGFKVTRSGTGWDDLAPVADVFEFSENVVDSAVGLNQTELHFVLTDETDIDWGYITCADAKGNRGVELIYNTSNVYNYKKGTYTSPKRKETKLLEYRVPLEITPGQAPGNYACWISTRDSLHHQKAYNNIAVLTVEDSTSQADVTPPELVSTSFSESMVDVGSAAAQAKLTFQLKDKNTLGWSYLNCEFSKNGKLYRILGAGVEPNVFYDYDRGWVGGATFSGEVNNMTFEIPVKVPLGTYPGRYECWIGARDKFGNGARYVLATFDVFRTPAGQPSSPQSLSFTASKPTSGTLSWSAPVSLGDPALSAYVFEYSTDGVAWQALPKSGTKTTSISVSGLKPDSEYWFRVRGENGGTVGQDTNFMSLNWATTKATTPKPVVADTPQNLVISDVSTNGYKLSWSTPGYNGGSTVTDYRVEVSSDAGKTWKTAKQTESTSTSLTVSGALPGTVYQIRIAAVNGVGASTWLVGNTTTLVAKPSSPRNLTTSKVAATSLTASWSLPTTNGGAPISDYQLELSSNNGSTWTTVNDGVSNNLAINLTGLLKNRAYLLRVSAVNSAGVGPASETVSASTLATVATAPTAFTASEVQSTSATVAWSAPTDFGGVNLSDYRVETSVDGKTWQLISKTGSVSRSLKLNGLAPGTTYQVRIAAINSVGASVFLTGLFKTLATAPSSPRSMAATNVTTNSMSVSWLIPSTNGGSPLTDYQVELAVNCLNYTVVADGVSVNLGVQLSGLKPGLRYCVRVSAQNAVGTSPSTPVLEVKTLDNKPSAPTALAVKPATTSIALSWAKSVVLNGSSVSDYVIEYSSNNGVSWVRINDGQSSKTSATVSGLKSKRTYLFRVSAVNLAGASSPSKTLKVTTK